MESRTIAAIVAPCITAAVFAWNIILERLHKGNAGWILSTFHLLIFIVRVIVTQILQRIVRFKGKYIHLNIIDAILLDTLNFTFRVVNLRVSRSLAMIGNVSFGTFERNIHTKKVRLETEDTKKSYSAVWITSKAMKDKPVASIPTIVYFHGGGYVFGKPTMYLSGMNQILKAMKANKIDVGILAVDYPLAPEHPFPAAIDYCEAVYRHVAKHPDMVGPELLVIGGDSAGGGLSCAVAVRIAEMEPELMPTSLLLFSPWVDHVEKSQSVLDFQDECIVSKITTPSSAHYLAGQDPNHPEVSLLRHPLLGNLPPTFVCVGGMETLRDEGLALAEKLKASDVTVQVERGEGMPHIYPLLYPIMKMSCKNDPFKPIAEFMTKHLASNSKEQPRHVEN